METVDILASTLAGLVQIAPKQDGRKYLCGVRFDTAGYAVATDGSMLLAARIPPFVGASFTVPRESIITLLKGIPRKARMETVVHVMCGASSVDGGIRVQYAPLDDHYPNWRHVVPTGPAADGAAPDVYDPARVEGLREALADMLGVAEIPALMITQTHRAGIVRTPSSILALLMPLRDMPPAAEDAIRQARQFLGEVPA